RLRITAHLTDVTTREQIWSERYDHQISDVFAIQDAIAAAVVGNLHVRRVESGRPVSVPRLTRKPEAYALYLKGRYHWEHRNLARALDSYTEAIVADADYAAAYAAIADCHVAAAISGLRRGSDVEPLGAAAADRAVALDGSLASAHRSSGAVKHWLRWDWQ